MGALRELGRSLVIHDTVFRLLGAVKVATGIPARID